MPLFPGVWLTARPLAVGLAPPQGQGARLDTALGLALDLAVQAGDPPPVRDPAPAAAPGLLAPGARGSTSTCPLALNYQTLGQALSQQLTGKTVAVQRPDCGDSGAGTGGGRAETWW